MDRITTCGRPTASGEPCRRPGDGAPCPIHEDARTPVPGQRPGRDLYALTWWVIEALMDRTIDPREAQTITSAARLLVSLGPEPSSDADSLADIVLRGRIMHGLPPDSPEAWARAARIFDQAAIAEMRRWEGLLELDE